MGYGVHWMHQQCAVELQARRQSNAESSNLLATPPPAAAAAGVAQPAAEQERVQCELCGNLEEMTSAGVGDTLVANEYLHSRAAADIAAWREAHMQALDGNVQSKWSGTCQALKADCRDLKDIATPRFTDMRYEVCLPAARMVVPQILLF
jgi:hypothetical protein